MIEPQPDPFEGMSPAERKRAQEKAILKMVYDLSTFVAVTPSERPDFLLAQTDGLFGVEVTQTFPSESVARLALVHGYMERLWAGGTHLHKEDRQVLHAAQFEVTDEDGKVKAQGLPGILVEKPHTSSFRTRLRETLANKAGKGYEQSDLRHLNLIVLDWFDLPFDPGGGYTTDRFFDDDMRTALVDSPFREVFLAVHAAAADLEDQNLHPTRRIIPLQQLLATERIYVTGHAIDEEFREHLRDVEHLNDLAVDHVSRVQGIGTPVEFEGRTFLGYRGTLAEISDNGLQVRDLRDSPAPTCPSVAITDRMPTEVEDKVSMEAAERVFGYAYAEHARKPSIWPSVTERGSQTVTALRHTEACQ